MIMDQWPAQVAQQEMRESARNNRAMERDAYKSNLKMKEMDHRQSLKMQVSDIAVYNDSVIKQYFDGNGRPCKQITLMSCTIEKILCYEYKGFEEKFWQVSLKVKEAEGYKIIESPLYPQAVLHSIPKLRTTILSAYCINDLKQQTDIWRWVQKLLINMLSQAEVKEIPFLPGWWEQNERWRFVTAEDENTLLLSKNIRRFSIKKSEDLTGEGVVEDLLYEIPRIPGNCGGVMMLYRMDAFIGRLLGDLSFSLGITLIGESAEKVAKSFLRTMSNEVDTINLDGDSIGDIRKRLIDLQDTPAIFLVSNPDSRTTRNKLEKVLSWKDSGYIGSIKKTLVFVFCLKKYSSHFPFENMVALDVEEISPLDQYYSFEKLQNYMLTEIENSGEYWIKEMRRSYEKHFREDRNRIISLNKAVAQVVSDILRCNEMEEHTCTNFQIILTTSESEISNQIMSKKGILVENFQKRVRKFADSGKIAVVSRYKATIGNSGVSIYFDDKYYYFTKDVLNEICKFMNMDFHSLLSLKQQLSEQGCLKMYRATSGRSAELQIDFRISNGQGEYKDLSGLAVVYNFFDEIGGVGLYELCSEE